MLSVADDVGIQFDERISRPCTARSASGHLCSLLLGSFELLPLERATGAILNR
ncbi:hypothetical protein GQ600_4441 [Phytophthora cactorum]|nr:hypothetical protein GQ600_4441 [Phytophthora cactorum]